MEKNKQEKLNEFLALSLRANEKGKYFIIIRYSGHVDEISFRILDKNKRLYNEIYADAMYISGNLYKKERFYSKINKWKDLLTKIIKNETIIN